MVGVREPVRACPGRGHDRGLPQTERSVVGPEVREELTDRLQPLHVRDRVSVALVDGELEPVPGSELGEEGGDSALGRPQLQMRVLRARDRPGGDMISWLWAAGRQVAADWDEEYDPASVGDSEVAAMVLGEADQLAYAAGIPAEVEPGTRWSYSSGDTMLLSGVVEEATLAGEVPAQPQITRHAAATDARDRADQRIQVPS